MFNGSVGLKMEYFYRAFKKSYPIQLNNNKIGN
jgi:hypothetical protein